MRAEDYGRIVQSKAARRRLMAASDEIKALALDETITTDDALNDASQKLLQLHAGASIEKETTFFDGVSNFFDLVERMMNNPNSIIGIPTGFTEIDRMLMGLQAPDLLVFAGRPGMGKSSFLLSVAMSILRTGQAGGCALCACCAPYPSQAPRSCLAWQAVP
jgi:replicative DNA helicase